MSKTNGDAMTDMLKEENREGLHSLTPGDGQNPLYGMTTLELGAAWDMDGIKKSRFAAAIGKSRRALMDEANESDADAIGVCMAGNKPIKYVGLDSTDAFKNDPQGGAGAVTSGGDNLTGEGEGDDETLTFKLDEIPSRVTRILLTVGAFKRGADVRKIKNMIVTIYDSSGGTKTPMAFVEPTLLRPKRMIAVAVLERDAQGWTLRVVDDSFEFKAGDVDEFLTAAMRF
jgi:stress response protein SCP2